MTTAEYFETGKYICNNYVPKSGQAKTIQGELLRAIEKLADEAQRNGNKKFMPDCHGLFITLLRKYLLDDKLFDKVTVNQIQKDIDTISLEDEPYTENDLFDRLRERIIEWYLKNKTPVPNPKNPAFHC